MKLMDEKDETELKAYLMQSLDAITDADSVMLAEYIVALLKNPVDDLQALCQRELADFLGAQTSSFVQQLFDYLSKSSNAANKSAATPSSTAPSSNHQQHGTGQLQQVQAQAAPVDARPPPSVDARESLMKASMDREDEDRRRRESRKRRFQSSMDEDQEPQDRSNARSNQDQDDRSYARSNPTNGRDRDRPDGWRKKGRYEQRRPCYDYTNLGYCTRGSQCSFDHGPEPIVASAESMGFSGPSDSYSRSRDARGGRGGRGRGRDFNSRSSRPFAAKSTKIDVTHLPPDRCNREAIVEYFSKYGHILQCDVQPDAQRATLEYSTIFEAERAHDDPEAPFHNRFVKIYWHRHDDTSASTPGSAQPSRVEWTAEERAQKVEESQSMRQMLQQKMELLQQRQAEERKQLIQKLPQLSETERSEIMKRLSTVTQTLASTPEVLTSTGIRLTTAQAASKQTGASTEMLQARLEAVRAEHAALAASRGRGRGGSVAAGRSLDLRPKTLIVRPQTAEGTSPEDLHKHFSQFGAITEFGPGDDDGSVYVSFQHRWEAEKAMKFGGNEQLAMEWHRPASATSPMAM